MEDMEYLVEMFYHCDVLFHEYSTVMIEPAIFPLPTINIRLYNVLNTNRPISFIENDIHIKRIFGYGASKNARTMEHFFECIELLFGGSDT